VTPAALVAHQGGWDEILLVIGPIAVIVGLLLLVRHRLGDGSTPLDDGSQRGQPTD
jgi:hypothetical protein